MSRKHRLIPQVVVTVNLTGNGLPLGRTIVKYSYANPPTPLSLHKSDPCSVKAPTPYYTIFALDYSSTAAGWHFRKHIVMCDNLKLITHYRAANRLSMTTLYEMPDIGQYSFYLMFENSITGACWSTDPQESNSTPPHEDNIPGVE